MIYLRAGSIIEAEVKQNELLNAKALNNRDLEDGFYCFEIIGRCI